MRTKPIIVYVPKYATRKTPEPVKILHVSRKNGAGHSMGVLTECGREIGYPETFTVEPSNFLEAGEDLMVEPEYDFQGKFKMCKRCGTPEEFSEAMEEYRVAAAAAKKRVEEICKAKAAAVSEMQCAVRATIIATILPGGVEALGNDGWGITFVHNGTPFILRPTEGECKRLHKAAEESVKCHSE